MEYEPVIGLEIHAQLKTDSKIFCGCSTVFGSEPNSQTCTVCLGMPGALPVLNKKAVEFAIKMGLATNCQIAPFSVFARKNYFYPDLPKAYQISMYEQPICISGFVEFEIDDKWKRVGLTRIHMEEDAGKLVHPEEGNQAISLVDLNRCGVPLIEIVSEPEISSPHEASVFLTKLRQLLVYLEICDGNMEEGSLRCDANVSVREKGSTKLGVRTEIKNMNSFRNVERALSYEIERQIDVLERGEEVVQETLLWDASANAVFSMRGKEEAHDYRYFPDPDLVPLNVTKEWLNEIAKDMPELPKKKKSRFMEDYGLSNYDAENLTTTKEIGNYFEKTAEVYSNYKRISNWILTEVLHVLNEQRIEITEFCISPEELGLMLKKIDDGEISGKMAKEIFEEMVATGKSTQDIIKGKGLVQITDTSEIETVISSVLEQNPREIQKYLDGKDKIFGFFVGQVMKTTRGKANPQIVNDLLKKKLEALK